MTNIKEVIHLYLGCEAAIGYQPNDISGMRIDIIEAVSLKGIFTSNADFEKFENVKPIFRRLDSMTEDEGFELCESLGVFTPSHFIEAIKNNSKYIIDYRHSFEITAYLLKQGFDLFGLIDSGQAIDKNLKP